MLNNKKGFETIFDYISTKLRSFIVMHIMAIKYTDLHDNINNMVLNIYCKNDIFIKNKNYFK